jgi:hypothetical protein
MSFSRRTTFVAIAILTLGAASLPAQQSPEEILARYSRTIDPEGRLAALEGLKSTLTMEMPAAGVSATITTVQRVPGQMVMVINIPALGEIKSGYDGTTAWSSDPMQGPRLVTGTEAAALIDGADLKAMGRYPALFSATEPAGEVDVDGDTAVCLKLTWKSSRVTTECYSTSTGLIVETRATQESPQGVIEAVARHSDYKAVNGILIAHRVVQSAMGMQQILTTTAVEFGPQDAAQFELPPEIRALRDR